MKLFRVSRHKRFVRSYIFRLRIDTINITLTASRNSGLSDSCVKRIENNAFLIRKYERRKKVLSY